LLAGKSPFEADRLHLHHRLLDMGHSPVQAVMIFYLWTAMVSLACLLVFITQSFFWPGIVVLAGGVICLVVTLTPMIWVREWLTQRGLLRLSGAPKSAHMKERTPSD
jgi:UDP-GlcNAc:undecaprenyl-phosphate GlcNAc-1-phosphate transferase